MKVIKKRSIVMNDHESFLHGLSNILQADSVFKTTAGAGKTFAAMTGASSNTNKK